MTSYTIHPIYDRPTLSAAIDVIFHAQHHPYMPSTSMLFPTFGYSDTDRASGLAAAKERLWTEHATHLANKNEDRGWICVRDPEGEVVAAVQWEIHPGSPFPNGCPKLELPWWPEGEAREFCQEMFRQAFTPRSLWMQRPHGGINMMVVHPKHRSRGVGGLMMRWVNERLDERGIEGFLEASPTGRSCYERHGYLVVMKVDFSIPLGKADVWQKLEHDMKPPAFYAMWRPKYGQCPDKEGRTKPWQLRSPLPI